MNEMTMKEELKRVNAKNNRSAWNRGVNQYSKVMLDDIIDSMEWYKETFDEMNIKLLKNRALNGASDWAQYSWGGCSLIYDEDIAKRLCNPTELKITNNGRKAPNKNEEWLDVQARALYQAFERIKTAFNNLKEKEV